MVTSGVLKNRQNYLTGTLHCSRLACMAFQIEMIVPLVGRIGLGVVVDNTDPVARNYRVGADCRMDPVGTEPYYVGDPLFFRPNVAK